MKKIIRSHKKSVLIDLYDKIKVIQTIVNYLKHILMEIPKASKEFDIMGIVFKPTIPEEWLRQVINL
jgi:hypothetical protein